MEQWWSWWELVIFWTYAEGQFYRTWWWFDYEEGESKMILRFLAYTGTEQTFIEIEENWGRGDGVEEEETGLIHVNFEMP